MNATAAPTKDLRQSLQQHFGYQDFRPIQEEAINAVLAHKDVFVVMPTGGGKSLCYQLPALLLPGTTVVISPLISLMKDQVDALQRRGISATFINSSLDAGEIMRRRAKVISGQIKLLYVAPERLLLPQTLDLLQSIAIPLVAIDEAHCISQWGHDFRPEYRALGRLSQIFPKATLAAFTATATRRVEADIIAQLRLEQAEGFRGSFNRPNLYYAVRAKERVFDQVADYCRRLPASCGIVYCGSRDTTDSVAARLRDLGVQAQSYHAGLDAEERRTRQEAFQSGTVPVLVATIAFGMGIDKPDVRFVIHYDLPQNLEGFYQESGRAGRDGLPSDCIVFHGAGDVHRVEYFIQQKADPQEQRIAREQLREMVSWAESPTCRRERLLGYFDEQLTDHPAACCDACGHDMVTADYTLQAQKLLSCAKRTGQTFGLLHLLSILLGSREKRILDLRHDRLPFYGTGRETSKTEWRAIAGELVRQGYLRKEGEPYSVAKVTPLGEEVLAKDRRVSLSFPKASAFVHNAAEPHAGASARSARVIDYHQALFEELRVWRRSIAEGPGVAAFAILWDSTLKGIARELPTNPEALGHVSGVGSRIVTEHGPRILAIVRGYVTRTEASPMASAPKPPPLPRTRTSLGGSPQETLRLFRAGSGPAEIAQTRNLAVSTIQGHLAEALKAGEALPLERLINAERRLAIEAAITAIGDGPLKPIKERLGDDYSYNEIRLVRVARVGGL